MESGSVDKRGGAVLERLLPAHDLVELLLELFLIEQLPAGDAVDLGAQLRDPVLVGELLFLLPGDEPRQHVVVEGEVGAGRERPAGHDHEAAHRDPEGDRSDGGPDGRNGPACNRPCAAGAGQGRELDGLGRDGFGRDGFGGAHGRPHARGPPAAASMHDVFGVGAVLRPTRSVRHRRSLTAVPLAGTACVSSISAAHG